MNAKGFVHKYGDNVDTDVIIPARYLNIADKKELATHCMEDIDKHFVDVVKAGDVMVGASTSLRLLPGARPHGRSRSPASPASSPRPSPGSSTATHQHRPGILECPEASENIQSGDEVAIDFDTGSSPTSPRARPTRPTPSRRSSRRSSRPAA